MMTKHLAIVAAALLLLATTAHAQAQGSLADAPKFEAFAGCLQGVARTTPQSYQGWIARMNAGGDEHDNALVEMLRPCREPMQSSIASCVANGGNNRFEGACNTDVLLSVTVMLAQIKCQDAHEAFVCEAFAKGMKAINGGNQ
jgi:hypothetical protein